MRRATAHVLEDEVRVELRRLSLGEQAGWPEAVARLFDARSVTPLVYTPTRGCGSSPRLRLLAAGGASPAAVQRGMEQVATILTYDPWKVGSRERNRVLQLDDLQRLGKMPLGNVEQWHAFTTRIYGTRAVDQLRLLVCEGATALAWVGALSLNGQRPFDSDDRRLLQRLALDLLARLQLEARLEHAPLAEATLEALFETLEQPAWLVDARGRVVLQNEAGSTELGRAPSEVAGRLAGVPRGDVRGYRVANVTASGLPQHWLVLAKGEAHDAGPRVANARAAWGLTQRETQVLALVARGLTNEAIGLELECAQRTVELHVTRLLAKGKVENRASLVAKFWAGR